MLKRSFILVMFVFLLAACGGSADGTLEHIFEKEMKDGFAMVSVKESDGDVEHALIERAFYYEKIDAESKADAEPFMEEFASQYEAILGDFSFIDHSINYAKEYAVLRTEIKPEHGAANYDEAEVEQFIYYENLKELFESEGLVEVEEK